MTRWLTRDISHSDLSEMVVWAVVVFWGDDNGRREWEASKEVRKGGGKEGEAVGLTEG